MTWRRFPPTRVARTVADSASGLPSGRRRYNEAVLASGMRARRAPGRQWRRSGSQAGKGWQVSSDRSPAARARNGHADARPRRRGVRLARSASCLVLLLACAALMVRGQGDDTPAGLRIEVDPAALTLETGEVAQLSATVRDAGGAVVDTGTEAQAYHRGYLGAGRKSCVSPSPGLRISISVVGIKRADGQYD